MVAICSAPHPCVNASAMAKSRCGVGQVRDFLEIPARHLYGDVIECGFKIRARCARDRIRELFEGASESEFRGDECKRIPSCFRRECGAPREPRIHFDHLVGARARVESVLDIALSDDAKVADGTGSDGPQQMVVLVIERLAGGDHDGFSCMVTKRIDVFHIADGDAIVCGIPDNFILNFLPTGEVFLNEDGGGFCEGEREEIMQSSMGNCPPTSFPAERKRSTRNDWVYEWAGN